MQNVYFIFQAITAFVFMITGKHMQGALILAYIFVYSLNHSDLAPRIIFGTKASLPYEGIELITKEVGQMEQHLISGSFYKNLLICISTFFASGVILHNIPAAILCVVQVKLLTEQHRDKPNRYIVVGAHILPSVIFYTMLPPAVPIVKAIVAAGVVLLIAQSMSILSKLKKGGV